MAYQPKNYRKFVATAATTEMVKEALCEKEEKRWVIRTNQNRYVSIPYILRSGFRSFLDETPIWNKTKSFPTKEEAEEHMAKYMDPEDPHYVDRHSYKDGEKLDGVTEVVLVKEK